MNHQHDDPPSFEWPDQPLVDTVRAGIDALKRRNGRDTTTRGEKDEDREDLAGRIARAPGRDQ